MIEVTLTVADIDRNPEGSNILTVTGTSYFNGGTNFIGDMGLTGHLYGQCNAGDYGFRFGTSTAANLGGLFAESDNTGSLYLKNASETNNVILKGTDGTV